MINLVLQYFSGSREKIAEVLRETNYDLTETLVKLIETPNTVCAPKQKTMTDDQLFFKATRDQLEILDKSIRDGFTSQDQHASLPPSDLQILPEEMVQQNNCFQECHLPFLGLTAQKQGIACPSQSEYSSDSQSDDQKLS